MNYFRLFIVILSIFISFSAQADEKEVECLAKNIYYEARNGTFEDKLAVAFVTYNRVKDTRQFRKNNYCDIIWQKGQFEWTQDGKSDNPYEKETYAEIVELASEFYENPYKFEDPVDGALFYHADYVTPCWLPDAELIKDMGTHHFYNVDPKGTSCLKGNK